MTIIPAFPYTLTNGTTADANQVMADLNNILTGVNTNGAANGPNSDITSLTGLTTPLSVSQGGTGANNAAGALVDLGAAPSASPTFSGTSTFNGPVAMTSSPNTIKGVADNSNAAAGYVGEFITASGSGVSLASGTGVNVTSISLTAGDWDVGGVVSFTTTTNFSAIGCSVSTTSATFGALYSDLPFTSAIIGSGAWLPTPPMQRLSLSATTIVYLVALISASSGTATASGTINARRRR